MWRHTRPVRVAPIILAHDETIVVDEDACYSDWYGCGEDGCCVDSEWWAPTMPPHAFLQEGLVHKTRQWDATLAFCGASSVPYGVQLHSTDEALEYARQLNGEASVVTCFFCVSYEMVIIADVWP